MLNVVCGTVLVCFRKLYVAYFDGERWRRALWELTSARFAEGRR